MKKLIQFSAYIILVFLLSQVFNACDFNNFTKDKETGEDLNLLIVDIDFFNTKFALNIFDTETGQAITDEAKISISGKNAGDIVDFTGIKHTELNTTTGKIEFSIDPTVTISENSPVELSLTVEVENYITTSKTVRFYSEGQKTIDINLAKETEEESTSGGDNGSDTIVIVFDPVPPVASSFKSAQTVLPYTLQMKISKDDILEFKDGNGALIFTSEQQMMDTMAVYGANFFKINYIVNYNFIPQSEILNINDSYFNLLFHKQNETIIKSMYVGATAIHSFNGFNPILEVSYNSAPKPDNFGFWKFMEHHTFIGSRQMVDSLPFQYLIAQTSALNICDKGASIQFNCDKKSSFSLRAKAFDELGRYLTSFSFNGTLPETFQLENVPETAFTLKFEPNYFAFEPIPDLKVDDPCNGNYSIDLIPKSDMKEFNLALTAYCSENPSLAIGVTYNIDYRPAGINAPWQEIQLKGGVAYFLAQLDTEYELRVIWEGKYEYINVTTNLGQEIPMDENTKVEIWEDENGVVHIIASHLFEQDICNQFMP